MARRPVAVVGVLLGVSGLALAVVPGLAPTVGVGDLLVTAVGTLALLGAVRIARDRLRAPVTWTETPEPEAPQSLPTPGDEFDATLADAAGYDRESVAARDRLRARLAAVATTVVARNEGIDEATARDRLADGTWTDDPHAAAFFGDDDSGVGIGVRARDLVRSEPVFVRRARRTVAVLTRLAEPTAPDDGGTDR